MARRFRDELQDQEAQVAMIERSAATAATPAPSHALPHTPALSTSHAASFAHATPSASAAAVAGAFALIDEDVHARTAF